MWVVEGEMSPLSQVRLSLDIVPSTYEVYFSCLAFGFLCISSCLFLARPMFFCVLGNFVMNRRLGVCVFFFVFGFFSRCPGVWILG